MKSPIVVMINSCSVKIEEQLKVQLEKHRLDYDSFESIRSHHWDYWFFPDNKSIWDNEVKEKFPEESEEVLFNSCYVKNLPNDYKTTGVICPNGEWTDLQDFGWRMIREPSEENTKAYDEWETHFKSIMEKYSKCIAIQIITHC